MECSDLLGKTKVASGFCFVFLAFWYRIKCFLLLKKNSVKVMLNVYIILVQEVNYFIVSVKIYSVRVHELEQYIFSS